MKNLPVRSVEAGRNLRREVRELIRQGVALVLACAMPGTLVPSEANLVSQIGQTPARQNLPLVILSPDGLDSLSKGPSTEFSGSIRSEVEAPRIGAMPTKTLSLDVQSAQVATRAGSPRPFLNSLPLSNQSFDFTRAESPSGRASKKSRGLGELHLTPSNSVASLETFSRKMSRASLRAALPPQTANLAVHPVLECVTNNGGGSYTAFFGYKNDNSVSVTIPVGSNNKFTPTPIDRGQTTTFLPGRQVKTFNVPFNGSNLVWYLKGPDNSGRTSTASSNSAACADPLPIANAGPNQTVFVDTTVRLDGTHSSDPEGHAIAYAWSFVSIPSGSSASLSNATSASPTFFVDKPGSYTVQLIVNDGTESSSPSQVIISTKNSPPVANAGPNQTVTTHMAVQLDGSR